MIFCPQMGDEHPSDLALRYLQSLNLSLNYSDFLDDLSRILNRSDQFIDPDLLAKYRDNRSVDSSLTFYLLICAYAILIFLGSFGNGLVVVAVVRKPAMRTARNLFIVNLAVSDLLLCLVTMPLTLMEVLTIYWPLGTHDLPCKMLGALQATSIFVSTISITAIALDR
jgi:neuropeptide F receptor